ncbi:ATP-dependent dethiobiotin synthetase BioD [Luteimonas sp. 9C]|uniref:dethiobiotin synthase n=1 Tax=Luteimonas sp. 9C TaxID=2653148 RepID=UPI0012F105EA|nr:dethiobiotin synthase [Luteimonas sp. 9C]VXB64496.1 ATP-dependent dethiobiotin synthetase BioD [Luteimonas sp. 9C]
MSARSFLVTGTDTGIGKTHSSVALLHALRAHGLRAVGMKPIASGCDWLDGRWRNEDALALQAASDPRPEYVDVNPVALPEPTAPTLAAIAAGVTVDIADLYAAHGRLASNADVVLVEGAGGWDAPLADGLEHQDFARHIGGAVVLVVGLKLGCLSHARLTARAIEADGCRLVGWIGNRIDPDFARADDYIDLLTGALPAPCLGVLPFVADGGDLPATLSLDAGWIATL